MVTADLPVVLSRFGLRAEDYVIERVGSGHINHTYKLTGPTTYIVQRINNSVFRNPEIIADNLRLASEFLRNKCPEYPFLTAIPSVSGKEMEYDAEGYPWRLFPYIDQTETRDVVTTPHEAREAATAFGRLSRHLDGVDISKFHATIPRFHDLALRMEQFEEAQAAAGDRTGAASEEIQKARRFAPLVEKYRHLINGGSLRLRLVHNDTKINNVLFDRRSGKTVAVIDLDTLMPGYFIYDLGDMVRTFVSPVSEEERDLSKVRFRKEIYEALVQGYLSEMSPVMSKEERKAIPFAGKMMTYIMAIRFLADYLRGNTYYHITYPEQNLVRAANQLKLLEVLEEHISDNR